MTIQEITSEQEFDQAIKSSTPVLVDFWATWCMPCKMLAPIIYEFSQEMGDKIKVLKVDVDEISSLAYRYNIVSIPMVAVFKDGEMLDKTVGLTSKAGLSNLVIKYL